MTTCVFLIPHVTWMEPSADLHPAWQKKTQLWALVGREEWESSLHPNSQGARNVSAASCSRSQTCCPVGEVREVLTRLRLPLLPVCGGGGWGHGGERREKKSSQKRHETRTLSFLCVQPLESILSNSSRRSQDSLRDRAWSMMKLLPVFPKLSSTEPRILHDVYQW